MLRQAGLSRIRFHDLRHFHATHLLMAGIHPKVVPERLGHATTGVALDTYSHVVPSLQEAAARAFAGVMAERRKAAEQVGKEPRA